MPDYLEKLNSTLDDAFKGIEDGADAEAVHLLRTSLRRLEAFADAGLPKRFRTIRKQAGQVRDLDVLGSLVEKLELNKLGAVDAERLTEHIRSKREKEALKLAVQVHDADRSRLRRWEGKHAVSKPMGEKRLFQEFAKISGDKDFENLGAHNLHDFRLKIKPLRYRAEDPKDENRLKPLRNLLKEMQGSIGDWHDLMLLKDAAEQTLRSESNAIVKKVRAELQRSYEECIEKVLRLKRTLLMLSARQKSAGRKSRARATRPDR